MPNTTIYSFGDVVLVPFPFTNQTTTKKRPAVIVSSAEYNKADLSVDIRLDDLTVPSGESISIQVKGKSTLKECPDAVDCLIGFGVHPSPKCFGDEWLFKQVKAFPKVANWLKRSLSWLPPEFIIKCGL
jgi:hypothetical protein